MTVEVNKKKKRAWLFGNLLQGALLIRKCKPMAPLIDLY